MPNARPLLLVALSTTIVACRSREDRARDAQREAVDSLARAAARLAVDTGASTTGGSPVGRATVPERVGMAQVAGAAGDSLRIVSTDGTVIYTLARDTVRMQLGDTVMQQVRQKMAADTSGGTFGAFIKQTVAGAVGSAMRFVLKTPVREIRSARYENGELQIDTGHGGSSHTSFNTGGKEDKSGGKFAPADAERFVAAIEARRRALGVE